MAVLANITERLYHKLHTAQSNKAQRYHNGSNLKYDLLAPPSFLTIPFLKMAHRWNLFNATNAATIEHALDPNPEPIGIFFSGSNAMV